MAVVLEEQLYMYVQDSASIIVTDGQNSATFARPEMDRLTWMVMVAFSIQDVLVVFKWNELL